MVEDYPNDLSWVVKFDIMLDEYERKQTNEKG